MKNKISGYQFKIEFPEEDDSRNETKPGAKLEESSGREEIVSESRKDSFISLSDDISQKTEEKEALKDENNSGVDSPLNTKNIALNIERRSLAPSKEVDSQELEKEKLKDNSAEVAGVSFLEDERDEPDYHMRYWVKNYGKNKKSNILNRESEGNNKEREVPADIWDGINSMNAMIRGRIIVLSGAKDPRNPIDLSKVKKIAENLRMSGNNLDANELMVFLGAFKRVWHCIDLLKERRLDDFAKYIRKLPREKGASISVFVNSPQYRRIVKILENLP